MKLLFKLLFVGIVSLTTSSVFSQKGKVTEVKAVNSTYVYETYTSGNTSMVSVKRKNSIPAIYSENKSQLASLSTYRYSSTKPISKSLVEAFGTKRLKELSAEIFLLHMFIDKSGSVTGVRFLLKSDTKINLSELEKFEDIIKKNVEFSLSEADKKLTGPLAPVTQSIHIGKVLDGTSVS